MNDEGDNHIPPASSPASTLSCKTSISEDIDQILPTNLATEELQLALNRVNTFFKCSIRCLVTRFLPYLGSNGR